MTRDEAVADYAAHVERNGGASIFTEDQWVEWKLKPAGYRGTDGGTGVEHFTRAWGWVPGYEPGPGRDPGLFGGWTMP